MPTITKTVTTSVEVEVDVDIEDEELLDSLDDDQLAEEAEARGLKVMTSSRASRHGELTRRAIACVRAMQNRPRELEDFFYEVHGEAM
jgi:hypothetical protein